MAGLLGVYLLTADVTSMSDTSKSSSQTEKSPEQELPQEILLAKVTARTFPVESIYRTLTLFGETLPDRTVTISAEIPARVVSATSQKGQFIKRGETIVNLREGALPAQIATAKARVRKAELDYNSALSLKSKNLIAENELPQLEVALSEARSELSRLEIDFANTKISAPVTGILNDRFVEQGDYIEMGKPVAEILDLDPLVVSVDVPQTHIASVTLGDHADIRFASGQTAEAQVRYIARLAESGTRTFKVELSLPNRAMETPAGLSVEAELKLSQVQAIKVSPALLSLNETGSPGIKWVDEKNKVHFTAVDIVKSEASGLWLTGIPTHGRLITRGHGFVREGDQVIVESGQALAVQADRVAGEAP
ncbi:efflux RND transporter periplasmic adaptor subunit [Endozoicomonas numazuensis]|uniref:efflux RND transporter periplasmic adaptor subunit n=1 Tax=Endozoicomonas numazuensis TaxID=1137799 RepID=UPI00068A8BCD|nr:efflux RND transporter periplasmic adaptor subunit [Endozoicomonas numazuensis]